MEKQIEEPVKSSINKHWDEAGLLVDKAVEFAKQTISENALFIDNVVRDARAGASYVAVNQMIEKVIDDSLNAATPLVEQFSKLLATELMEATKEVIIKKMQEEVAKKIKG